MPQLIRGEKEGKGKRGGRITGEPKYNTLDIIGVIIIIARLYAFSSTYLDCSSISSDPIHSTHFRWVHLRAVPAQRRPISGCLSIVSKTRKFNTYKSHSLTNKILHTFQIHFICYSCAPHLYPIDPTTFHICFRYLPIIHCLSKR